MKPLVLFHFYRVRLRSRFGAELLAVTGIAVGVSLVFAALIANASLNGSVRELSEGIVGGADLQLSARSAAGFDERVLRKVEAIPGAAAAPVVEVRANLVGPAGRRSVLLVGGESRHGSLGGPLLRSATSQLRGAAPGLLLPAPLARGLGVRRSDRLAVETGAGGTRVPVAGELGSADVGALAESPVALAPLPLVQELAGMRGRISRVFVAAQAGHEREVERALRRISAGRLNVAPADEEAAIFEHAAYPTSRSTSLFSLLSALVGFLFALDATLLTVPQRRHLIADLRLAGYAPATVARILLFDALFLGLVGTALGLALGAAVSRLLFAEVPGYLTSAFAIGSQRVVSWQSIAWAVGAGLLAACLSVLMPMWTFLRGGQEAEASRVLSRSRQDLLTAAGFAALALALGISAVAPSSSLGATALLLLALLLLLGGWLRLATAAFDRLCRRSRRLPAILAGLELRAGGNRVRTLALVATGAVAVFAAVSIGGGRADLQRGLDGIAADLDRGAGVWVAFRGPSDIFGTTAVAIPQKRLRAIEQLAGVRSISRNRGSFLDVRQDRVWVVAPAPARVGRVLGDQVEEGDAAAAARRLRCAGWVALSEGLAGELGVGVGDRVDLPLPRPTRLRVAALTNNFGWPGGAIVMNATTYRRAWGSRAFSTLGVRLRPAASPAKIAAAVTTIVGERGGLRAETTSQRLRRQRAASRAGLSRLGQISAMVLIASALAMAASMAAVVWQRRPTFAALKLHGLTAGELWGALLVESTLLLGAGCCFGAAFGIVGQLLLDRALEAITGFPVISETAAGWASAVLLEVTGAAVAVLALPGWLAVKVRPRAGLDPGG